MDCRIFTETLRNTQDLKQLSDTGSNLVAINPVFLGKLPEKAMAAIENENVSLDTYKKQLRRYLPEDDEWLYVQNIGSDGMKLRLFIHPHFTNLIFIEDEHEAIAKLPHDKMLVFMRMMMAKVGAFKNIIVTYRKEGDGIAFDQPILGTMEGGRVKVKSWENMADRLIAFGSSEEVGGQKILEDQSINYDEWTKNPVVNGMRKWGKFLGEHRLLSPPVTIRELTRSRNLSRKIERLLRYNRQAEGAFWAVVPDIKVKTPEGTVKKTIKIVSNSGTSGAVKDRLRYSDISAVVSHEDGKVNVSPVKRLKTKKTSVEAEEFIIPLDELPTVKVKLQDGFYEFDDVNGTEVPALRAGFHLHRGVKSYNENKIKYITLDYPHVGCGVKTMQEMSRQAMHEAVRLWEKSGRKLELILVYAPNHGVNGFIPYAEGFKHVDPFYMVEQMIEDGDLELEDEVPQNTEWPEGEETITNS